jgi:hypothetical protein
MNNNLDKYKLINYDFLIHQKLKEQIKILNDNVEKGVILDFEHKEVDSNKLKNLVIYLYCVYDKQIILRNILQKNYDFIRMWEMYFEVNHKIKQIKNMECDK